MFERQGDRNSPCWQGHQVDVVGALGGKESVGDVDEWNPSLGGWGVSPTGVLSKSGTGFQKADNGVSPVQVHVEERNEEAFIRMITQSFQRVS